MNNDQATTENLRQERMLERIQEDEGLRGDLAGEAAQQLVNWASDKVRMFTADREQPDDVVEARVQAVRRAARNAAQAGTAEPEHVVALAEAALAANTPVSTPPESSDDAQPWFRRTWRRWRTGVGDWFKSFRDT